MPVVKMHIGDAEGLVDAYSRTSQTVQDALVALSPLVTEALALLDQPGQNPLYGPMPALRTVATGLGADGDDLAWRVKWLEEKDAQPLDVTGRVAAYVPHSGGSFDLEDALKQEGLTEEEQERAKAAIERGADYTDAIADAKQKTRDDQWAAFRRQEAEAWGESDFDNSAVEGLRDTGLSESEITEILEDAERTGQSVEEAHLRFLASEMTDADAAGRITVLFDEIAGDDDRIQAHELRAATADESLSDEDRAAAIRVLGAFDNVDVAKQTNLEDSLGDGNGFDLSQSDGDISTRDLAEYADKNEQVIAITPWLPLLDIAAKGGDPDGNISDDDIDAFLAIPGVPDEVKQAVVEVFGPGSGDYDTGFASSPLPGTIPQFSPVGTPAPVAPATPPPSSPGGSAYATAFIVGWMAGWEVGGAIDDHIDGSAPSHITLIDPETGRTVHVPLEQIEDLPVEEWPGAIQEIIASNGNPSETPAISIEVIPNLEYQALAETFGVTVEQIEHCVANHKHNRHACRGLPEGLLEALFGGQEGLGQRVDRTIVFGQEGLLEFAEEAAGGSLDDLEEVKPGWFEGVRPTDGKVVRIEWETEGHATTNEGPHVTVREQREDDPSKWRVVDKAFIFNEETFRD